MSRVPQRSAQPYVAEPLSLRPPVVLPDAMLPRPLPAAPLDNWTTNADRTTVSVEAPDATLRGWTYKAPHPDDPALLFFNGNAMSIDEYDSLYAGLAALGAHVTVFDYRGFGFSTGTADVMAFRQDALHLYQVTLLANPGRKVVVFGYSLGTAMATFVAARFAVSALILAGTIASAAEEVPVYAHDLGLPDRLAKYLVPSAEVVETLDEVHYIARSTAPLLMLHGETDTVVPIEQGREVFAASASTQKKFVSLPGAGHSETLTQLAALEAIATFLLSLKQAQP
jgi:pimeloyl-ACP methyl ester carboxylesterase